MSWCNPLLKPWLCMFKSEYALAWAHQRIHMHTVYAPQSSQVLLASVSIFSRKIFVFISETFMLFNVSLKIHARVIWYWQKIGIQMNCSDEKRISKNVKKECLERKKCHRKIPAKLQQEKVQPIGNELHACTGTQTETLLIQIFFSLSIAFLSIEMN